MTEGFDKRTVENWSSLSRTIKPEILAEAPSIGHADAIRSLPLSQQRVMIQASKDEQLTVAELRQRVRNDQIGRFRTRPATRTRTRKRASGSFGCCSG